MQKQKQILIEFIMASKYIKYLGINLTKNIQDLYTESYRTLLRKIEDKNYLHN